MNEFVSRNNFMVKGEHSTHSVLPWFNSTTHPFQEFEVPNVGLLGGLAFFPSVHDTDDLHNDAHDNSLT